MPDGTSPRKTIAHSVVHLRREPGNDAERVSQQILGQTVTVWEARGDWSLVESDDHYRGWAENRWLMDTPSTPLQPVTAPFAEVRAEPDPDASLVVRLPLGAMVHVAESVPACGGRWSAVTLPDAPATRGWLIDRALAPVPRAAVDMLASRAVRRAADFLGTPYLWGGTTPFGLDCSGLTQLCYRLEGVLLPRDAWMQRGDPRLDPVAYSDLLPGDLVFFGTPERITHVGMQWDEGRFIHASSGAGVQIFPWGEPRYSPRFVDARRLAPARADLPLSTGKTL